MKAIAIWLFIIAEFASTFGQSNNIEAIKAKAETEDTAAQMQLADAYENGGDVEIDNIQAAYWLKKAAEAGNPDAQNRIGTKIRLGSGIRKDPAEAIIWYLKSAKQGNAAAMFNLGTAYYNGDGVVISDSTALAWFIVSEVFGSKNGADAVQRGLTELRGLKLTEGLMAASEMLLSGNWIPDRPEAAAQWLRSALDAGRMDATVSLAKLYLEGKGVPKNPEMAAEYCSQGAQANNPRAYACLGFLFHTGQGKPKSPEMAAHWYERAAKCGELDSIYRISQLYGSGEGVKQNRVHQYAMLLVASKAISEAQEEAVRIKPQLTDKDIRNAEKAAKKFVQNLDGSCHAPILQK